MNDYLESCIAESEERCRLVLEQIEALGVPVLSFRPVLTTEMFEARQVRRVREIFAQRHRFPDGTRKMRHARLAAREQVRALAASIRAGRTLKR